MLNDSLAAPFNPPPSPLDMLPALRWAARDEYSADGELLVDVIHHVEIDGVSHPRVSLVEATRDGRHWSFWAIEGDDLDDATEILLAGDLTRDYQGGKTSYRIDPLDMRFECTRMNVAAYVHGCGFGIAGADCYACQLGAPL